MTSEKDIGPLSDTEGGEKPVREQLRKAHITSGQNASKVDPTKAAVVSEHEGSNGESIASEERGRLHRKRSHEEVEDESQEVASGLPKQHTRKRSRDSTAEENELNNGQRKVSGERARNGDETVPVTDSNDTDKGTRPSTPDATGEKRPEDAVESMTSPKTKRSRIHSTVADDKDVAVAGEAEKTAKSAQSEEEGKSSGDKESTTKIPPSSGFANASATSPFGALAGSKSPTSDQPQTSASAFASSGFGSLAGSSTSGFGAIGKDSGGFGSGGSFATGAKSAKENANPSTTSSSSFGGALGPKSAFAASSGGNGFGSGASGFGKLGASSTGGFGGGLGGTGFSSLGGGGLSSFASGKTAAPLGGISKTSKPFGAPADEDERGEEDEDGDDKAGTKSPIATEDDKQDERFYEQELETGEEDESTEFSCRAKLYNFAADGDGKKEWRERGMGVVRLNVRRLPPDEDQGPKARLLMRAEGSHRVVLNTPVKKEMKYGSPSGEKPTGQYFLFMGAIDGKEGLEMLQLKMRHANALEMYEHVSKLQTEM